MKEIFEKAEVRHKEEVLFKEETKKPKKRKKKQSSEVKKETGCQVCGATSRGKPLCRKHYLESMGGEYIEVCQHPGCQKPSYGKPLCRKHYYGTKY